MKLGRGRKTSKMIWTLMFLQVLFVALQAASGTYIQVRGSAGCWRTCGRRGGKCERVCGVNGYCCRQGYKDCPPQMEAVALKNRHSCVIPEQFFHQVAGSAGCWLTCGRKGGKCDNVCGEGGYCCRKGYRDCPPPIEHVALTRRHSCVIPVPNEPYHQVKGTAGCWRTCGNKGGKCEDICGTKGYCCRQGYHDCPAKIAAVALKGRHSCVVPIPAGASCPTKSYVQVAGSAGCWATCGNKGGKCENVCGTNGYCCRQGYDDCSSEMAAVAVGNRHSCVVPAAPKTSRTGWFKTGTCTFPLSKVKCEKYGRRRGAKMTKTNDSALPHGCVITTGKNDNGKTMVVTATFNEAPSCAQCGVNGTRCVCFRE